MHVCWDLDRLTRQPRQLEDWIDAATDNGLKLTTANGEADLATDRCPDASSWASARARVLSVSTAPNRGRDPPRKWVSLMWAMTCRGGGYCPSWTMAEL
jgi:hypothetical protein